MMGQLAGYNETQGRPVESGEGEAGHAWNVKMLYHPLGKGVERYLVSLRHKKQ